MRKISLLVGASCVALIASMSSLTGALADDKTIQTAAADQIEETVVYGRGETRQVAGVTQQDILLAPPGSSPIKIISKLPGVNYQAADAYGAYEWAVRISVRGFNQNQLGFTLDDVPLGDMSYGNYNGLHISRAISTENMGNAELAQGTGALETASSSNLGGTVKFISMDPPDKMGALLAGTYGNYAGRESWRGFLRLETGLLPSGGKGYVSYDNQNSDKWKGHGIQRQQQVNGKFVQPIGDVKLTGFVNYSDRRENDYQDLSLALINRVGYTVDNISSDWPLAVHIADVANNRGDTGAPISNPAAGTTYPAPFTTVDDVYYNASGLRKDLVGGLGADWDINDNLTWKVMGYGHHNRGQGLWYTPYVPSPGGAPISIRTTEYEINRGGVVTSLVYKVGNHTIEGGLWFEDNGFHQARRFYGLDADGGNRGSLDFQSNPFFTQWEYRFKTLTYEGHVQDTLQVTDDLKLNAGFKTLDVKVTSTPVQGSAYAGEISSHKYFLPQMGFNYRLGDNHEIFGDFAENMRGFVGAATSGPFSASATAFAAIKDQLKPETSDTFELGYRARLNNFEGVIAGYYVKFHDRLLVISQCAGIVGCFSGLANVGSVTSYGVEAAGTYHITDAVSLFGSYAYNNSKYDDDVANATGPATPTAGKTVVDSPRHIVNGDVGYDNGSLFGHLGVNYMSKRFYTFLNDASVPSRVVADANVGYRFHGHPLLEGLEIQGNVSNLFNKKYVSTIGSNGFVNSDPAGTFQTLLAGAPREWFVTVRKQF